MLARGFEPFHERGPVHAHTIPRSKQNWLPSRARNAISNAMGSGDAGRARPIDGGRLRARIGRGWWRIARWLLRDPDLEPFSWIEVALVIALVSCAALLRALGSKFGFPFYHHWDETFVADSALRMVDMSTDQPTNYFYGAPMMRLTAMGLKLADVFHVPRTHLTDPILARMIARLVGVCISSSGVVAVHLGARFAFGRISAGVAAATLYVFASELVINGRFGVTDASVVALTAWTIAASAAYLRRPTILLGALAVLAAGVTFAFKLTGLAAVVFPLGVLCLRAPRGWIRAAPPPALDRSARSTAALTFAGRALAIGALPGVVLVCLFFNPHYSTHWLDAGNEIISIMKGYRDGHDKPYYFREHGWPHAKAALFYVIARVPHANPWVSIVVSFVALLGVVVAIARGNVVVMLATFHALGVVYQMAWKNDAFLVRMYLPPVLLLCLGCGAVASEIDRSLRRLANPWSARGAVVVAAALVVAFAWRPTKDALANRRFSRDARVRALDYLARKVHGAPPAVVAFTPSVASKTAIGRHEELDIDKLLERPNVIVETAMVQSCADVERIAAPYVITASYWVRDREGHKPFEDLWYLKECPGYRTVEVFPFNEYEQNLELQPHWTGRVSAILLERTAPAGAS
jgi:hypothetical protein